MYYSDDLIEEIRQRNDIYDVISGYVKLQKKGSSYFGLCPFHNEKSPSFSVTPSKQMYYCFGCGEGGNVISFIMKYENYTFVEAVKFLADRVGITLPETEYSAETKKQNDLRSILLEINKIAAKFFFYQLKGENGKQAYEYFTNRQLTDENIVKFGLGYCTKNSSDLYKYLRETGYQDEVIKESGLITFSEKGVFNRFFNRAMFPIMDVNNRVIGFGGRVMGEGQPKYLNSPETRVFDKSRNLYGMNFARISRKKNILICEGYMDVISLHQAGFSNAVASLGTAFTSQQAQLIKRYTNEVLLTYDSDGAGVKAALRAIPILKEVGLSAKIVNMSPYKDPDEFIKALGADEYQNRIDNARDSFLFRIDYIQGETDMNSPKSKADFQNQVAKMLLEFNNELERNVYIEAVSKEFRIPLDSLKKIVNELALSYSGEKAYEKPKSGINSKKKEDDGVKKSQRLLLTWLIEDNDLYPKLKKYIGEEDFIEPLYHSVASALFAQFETGNINPAKIISSFESEEEHSEVAELFNTSLGDVLSEQEKEKALNDTLFKVKKNSLDYKSSTVTDITELQNIIKEQTQLQKMHISLV